MPIYEYVCATCGTEFERLRPASAFEETARCPEGHASPRRVVSLFATVRAGSGGGEDWPVASTGGCACGGACSC
jgi:putative FmdB family regulatory protein